MKKQLTTVSIHLTKKLLTDNDAVIIISIYSKTDSPIYVRGYVVYQLL